MRRWSWLALVVLLLVTGCGASSNPDTTVLHAGDVAVTMETQDFTGAVGGVGVFGRLDVVAGGCVGLVTPYGRGYVVIFPPGTSIEGDSERNLAIHTEDVTLHLGDHVEAGSQYSQAQALSSFGQLKRQAPRTCRDAPAMPVDEFERPR